MNATKVRRTWAKLVVVAALNVALMAQAPVGGAAAGSRRTPQPNNGTDPAAIAEGLKKLADGAGESGGFLAVAGR